MKNDNKKKETQKETFMQNEKEVVQEPVDKTDGFNSILTRIKNSVNTDKKDTESVVDLISFVRELFYKDKPKGLVDARSIASSLFVDKKIYSDIERLLEDLVILNQKEAETYLFNISLVLQSFELIVKKNTTQIDLGGKPLSNNFITTSLNELLDFNKVTVEHVSSILKLQE